MACVCVFTSAVQVLQYMGRLPGALEKHNRALEIRLAVHGPNHPDVAQSLNSIGSVRSYSPCLAPQIVNVPK